MPEDHLAWQVLEWVELIDTSKLEADYSSLGRHGYHPKHLLGLWLLASLQGVHHASRLAISCKTDAAYRLVAGGHAPSATKLKDFRRNSLGFLADAVQQTVQVAVERGLVDPEQLSVDSARLQADTSTKSVRTVTRSARRLRELKEQDVASLAPHERRQHEVKVRKHVEALARCEREGRTSHSVTDPHAALMKFPNGAALPGHRVTVTSCGTDLRFVVSALITAWPNDFGHLGEAVEAARVALLDAGMPTRKGAPRMQVAADPGYLSEDDLLFVQENQSWLDVLIHEPPPRRRPKNKDGIRFFGREAFHIHDDGSATCPAGRGMKGPHTWGDGRRMWHGMGCGECSLKPECTSGKKRTLTQKPHLDAAHDAMRARMAEPGAKERYGRRIATVEPVFSYIEDAMGFRRVSSRKTETVKAEILLKILAYNLTRLRAGGRVLVAHFAGVWLGDRFRVLASWAPRWRTGDGEPMLAAAEAESSPSGASAASDRDSRQRSPGLPPARTLFLSIL